MEKKGILWDKSFFNHVTKESKGWVRTKVAWSIPRKYFRNCLWQEKQTRFESENMWMGTPILRKTRIEILEREIYEVKENYFGCEYISIFVAICWIFVYIFIVFKSERAAKISERKYLTFVPWNKFTHVMRSGYGLKYKYLLSYL